MCILERAISSIEEEVEKSDDPNIQAIGAYLMDRITAPDSTITELLLADGKSITSCVYYAINHIYRQAARRKGTGGCIAAVPDSQIYELAMEYYQSAEKQVSLAAAIAPLAPPKKKPEQLRKPDTTMPIGPKQMDKPQTGEPHVVIPEFEQTRLF